MDKFYSHIYVAKHLGVTPLTVTNWVDRPSGAFPMPVVYLVHNKKERSDTVGWSADQLPLLREWLAHRLNLSNPKSHWEMIENGGQPPGGHQDQGDLFDSGSTA